MKYLFLNYPGRSVDEFEQVPGLLFTAWISDEITERWGAVDVWESAEAADQAQRDFEKQFSRHEIPDHLEEFGLPKLLESASDKSKPTIVDFLVASGISTSRSAARRK